MTVLSKIFAGFFPLLLLLIITNHQGAVQKVFQLFFAFILFCLILYIYNLRRSKNSGTNDRGSSDED